MIFQCCSWISSLLGQRAGTQVARKTIFENDAPRGQRICQRLVPHHGNAVPDALCSQQFDGFADRLRTAYFSCVTYRVQSHLARIIKRGTKVHSGEGEFVAAHAKRNHAG